MIQMFFVRQNQSDKFRGFTLQSKLPVVYTTLTPWLLSVGGSRLPFSYIVKKLYLKVYIYTRFRVSDVICGKRSQ